MDIVHLAAVEHLLKSVYSHQGTAKNARISSFMYGKPDCPIHDRRFGTEIWLRRTELVKAALFVREHGAPYLRNLPMEDLQDRMLRFMTENYGYISGEVFLKRFTTSYAEVVSLAGKTALAGAIAKSNLFVTKNALKLYPLVPFQVQNEFVSESFFLIQPKSLRAHIPHIPKGYVEPEMFPPFTEWKGIKNMPASWLGVHSPASESADKMKAAILGAMALLPHRTQRFMFTGRHVFGGTCTVTASMSMSPGQSHTPPLSEDITITTKDRTWLGVLADKLRSRDLTVRRQMRALEYFYRAWGLSKTRERFPLLVMSIEALYSTEKNSTQSVVNGVAAVMAAGFPEARLRLLLAKLRASVIHGRSPEVYDADEYFPYYEAYESDPLHDLELIAARCLQHTVFDGKLVEHPHPYADLIKEKTGVDVNEDD